MASISRKKNKINISSKDLKKAIVDANNKLNKKNNNLKDLIKLKEKELKSLNKDYDSMSKIVGKLQREIEFQEDRLQKVNGGVYSSDRLLKAKLKAISEAESDLCEYESSAEKLENKIDDLVKKVESLEFCKSKYDNYKSDLSSIKVEVSKAKEDLESEKAKKDQIKIDYKVKLESYESEYALLEEKAQKHENMIYQFEQRLIDTQDLFRDENNKLEFLKRESEKERDEINQELQAIKNLCADTEDKYIEWEGKINKAKLDVEREIKKKQAAADNFAKWKIGVLEEVARLKLKNKVDNIDKAGLSDILNG